MSTTTKPAYKRSYPWAANHLKLAEAIKDLESAKALNPAIVIDEDSIKERYVIRKGALVRQPNEAKAPEGAVEAGTEAGEDKPEKAPKAAKASKTEQAA